MHGRGWSSRYSPRERGAERDMELSGRETMGMYLFLRKREDELDETLYGLYVRLQRLLCEQLSIEEMENIANLYEENVDVFEK